VGTTTDVDGNFRMENLPVGRYDLKVSFVGYGDALISEILLGSAKEVVLTIELAEQVQALGAVVVTAGNREPINEMAVVSAKSFTAEETKRYAASISDPARMAQTFAGVAMGDDASNEIIIRGNSPNWLHWRLEGVEIPSPNHFAEEGYSSGAVSILSSNMLGTSDFYTGAFPGEYGNALSGVFDLNLRNGNNLEYEHIFQIGVLGIDIASEGPFKKGYGGSYLFNYRYSTLSILNDLNFEISENALPNYQDLSFKLNLPTKKAGTFSIWSISGQSDVEESYLPDTTNGEKLTYGYEESTIYGMNASGLTHTIYPDKKSYIRSVASYSSNYSSQSFMDMDSLGNLNDQYLDDFKNKAVRVSSFYNRKLSSQMSVRTGVVLSRLNYNFFTHNYIDSTNRNKFLDSGGKTNLYQAYAQGKYKFTDAVKLTAGVHYTHFALNASKALEPRLGLSWDLPNKQKLSFGYGMHSRHESLPVYFVEQEDSNGNISMPNRSLELTKSNQFVIGYEKMVSDNVLLKTEVYYQGISNLAVPNNPDKYWSPIFGGAHPNDTLVSTGKGRNYGIELTVQKYFTNNYYFLISSSLFDSKYKPADGKWYNTKYNLNYVSNFVGGKEFSWGKKKMVGLNAKIMWTGGKRIIPINLESSIEEGKAVYSDGEIWSTKADDYFRLDIGAKLHFFKRKAEHVISLDIQNVTNRLNTWAEIYDSENEVVVNYPMAGLIPILSYRIEF
jgi:hypothetical protein